MVLHLRPSSKLYGDCEAGFQVVRPWVVVFAFEDCFAR
jgi:hypothetical protein